MIQEQLKSKVVILSINWNNHTSLILTVRRLSYTVTCECTKNQMLHSNASNSLGVCKRVSRIDINISWVFFLANTITLHLSIVAKKHSIATITKLRSLELLIKTPLLHILHYISGLTHDFWTRTGGWEFDHSHGAGTSSPSHWQQVEEQAPKPVGWMMCFLLMTLVPVQKLCVNIYLYICVHIPYTSSVIGCIYNGSVIQYWRSCTPSCSTGECAVPGLNTMLFSLVYQLCLALW